MTKPLMVRSRKTDHIRTGKLAGWSVEGALEKGDKAELAFRYIMEDLGYVWQKATTIQDREEHWDYRFDHTNPPSNRKVPFTVDIKSRKIFRWYSNQPQDHYICVEFRNTTGQRGWLYGQADYIAFERLNDFIVVPRTILEWIMKQIFEPRAGYHSNVEEDKNNADFICKPYHFMLREGKFDLFYWIETCKLFDFDYAILRKVQ